MNPVERHYSRGSILESIREALAAAGLDLEKLTPADLAPIDEFHIRGREATRELAARADIQARDRVLDVGCGLGGSARFLASEYGAQVQGIDLTQEYIDTAQELARLVRMDERTAFRRASALELPFAEHSFDVVWTQHVQMNIADKTRFYGEIARVLVPGGRLAFHDVFAGKGGAPHFPVPWAGEPEISHLISPDDLRPLLSRLGLEITSWEDQSTLSHDWLAALGDRIDARLGTHMLMGPDTLAKRANLVRSLAEGRIAVVQAVAARKA